MNNQKLMRLALLLAIEIVLSRFLSISTPIVKIGFSFVPLALCAMLYGPMWAMALAGLGDLLGASLFPVGPYFIGFTITAMLTGLVFGLCLHRRGNGWLGLVSAVTINAVVGTLLLNALWLHMLYGTSYEVLIPARLLQCAVLIPVQIVTLRVLAGQQQLMGFLAPVALSSK